jgi:hypothetical protein
MADNNATAAPMPAIAARKTRRERTKTEHTNDGEAAARVTVTLPSGVWEALEHSAKKERISKSEALRRAAWVYLFLMERLRSGCELVIERPDGNSERVIFPY